MQYSIFEYICVLINFADMKIAKVSFTLAASADDT